MSILDNFWIDDDSRIRLNTHVIVVRDYKTVEKTDYDETTYYINDASYKEWTEQLIPKHQLYELIADNPLDTSAYVWMDGIKLISDNHAREIERIAAYGSYDAYSASLEETRDAYQMELDYRISKIELGIMEV